MGPKSPSGRSNPEQKLRKPACQNLVTLIVALQHEKENESDDEYRSYTDVHKNLRFYFRVFIGTQAHALVGALPHVPKFSWKACMVWRRRDFETA